MLKHDVPRVAEEKFSCLEMCSRNVLRAGWTPQNPPENKKQSNTFSSACVFVFIFTDGKISCTLLELIYVIASLAN